MSNKIKRKLKLGLFFVLFALGLLLLWLPKDFFDDGQSICVSVVFFDTKCYGCGMTRAIQHLIHLDFEQASHYNKLSFIVFPLFVYLIIVEFIKTLKENTSAEKKSRY